MTDPETPPTEPDAPAAAKKTTLSTAVDDDLYEWFKTHAEENFRNISGQLAYVIHSYREQVEKEPITQGFAEALARNPQPWPRTGTPYVGAPDPGVQVRWDGPIAPGGVPIVVGGLQDRSYGEAAPTPDLQPGVPIEPSGTFPVDDDPQEGVT
jgi:hypothetical protein